MMLITGTQGHPFLNQPFLFRHLPYLRCFFPTLDSSVVLPFLGLHPLPSAHKPLIPSLVPELVSVIASMPGGALAQPTPVPLPWRTEQEPEFSIRLPGPNIRLGSVLTLGRHSQGPSCPALGPGKPEGSC